MRSPPLLAPPRGREKAREYWRNRLPDALDAMLRAGRHSSLLGESHSCDAAGGARPAAAALITAGFVREATGPCVMAGLFSCMKFTVQQCDNPTRHVVYNKTL